MTHCSCYCFLADQLIRTQSEWKHRVWKAIHQPLPESPVRPPLADCYYYSRLTGCDAGRLSFVVSCSLAATTTTTTTLLDLTMLDSARLYKAGLSLIRSRLRSVCVRSPFYHSLGPLFLPLVLDIYLP